MPDIRNNFEELWSKKSNEELFYALKHSDDYEQTSIEVIQNEIKKRNLDTEQTLELEASANNLKQTENLKAEQPLQWPLRILMLVLSFGILQLILGEYYRNRGYTRKYREVWRWMLYGILFWLAVSILKTSF